eukprot:TRINITY_DN16695_c1_g1_i1.p1 TRINITY_DN16695_c1_g1~~TRINITY_DN16695_c1_g1_i1.p1  ORF type:complete len:190 (+),score=47.53 TRINITY_DN16695_c1_g1_i1:94-663(+)
MHCLSIPSRKDWSEVESCPSYHTLLPVITEIVESIAQCGSRQGPRMHPLGWVFDCPPTGPGVSLKDFFIRLCKYGLCCGNTFVIVVVLLDRIATKAQFQITEFNIHKLLLGVFVVSIKLTEDRCYSNSYYAGIGGMSTASLNTLEKHTLTLLNWDLHVSETEFNAYLRNFEAYVQSSVPARCVDIQDSA